MKGVGSAPSWPLALGLSHFRGVNTRTQLNDFLRDSAGLWVPAELLRACVTMCGLGLRQGHSTHLCLELMTHLVLQGLDVVECGNFCILFSTRLLLVYKQAIGFC